MENQENKQEEKKGILVNRVIVILAILLILSVAGLVLRSLYHGQDKPSDSYVSVPENVLHSPEKGQNAGGASGAGISAGAGDSAGTADLTGTRSEQDKKPDSADSDKGDRNQENHNKGDSNGDSNGDAGDISETKAAYLELCETETTANQPFRAEDMLPGDRVTTYFCLKTHHKNPIPVYFRADITEQTKNLADVLRIKVSVPQTGETLYDMPFANADGKERAVKLPKSAKGETVTYYKVETYLETEVGNPYQGALLGADFSWYIKDADQEELTPGTGGSTGTGEPGETGEPSKPGANTDKTETKGGLGIRTGDPLNLALWVVLAGSSLALILLLVQRKRQADNAGGTRKKLRSSIAIAVLLALMLGITTYALFASIVQVEDNRFTTGTVKLNLNDGEPVITAEEYLFEPGMRVEKPFFIENEGSADAYYKLYVQDVEGGLADVIHVKVCEQDSAGEKVLYTGSLSAFTRGSAEIRDGVLAAGERKELTILFTFPESAGNKAQNQQLQFSLGAVATQTRNNPEHSFE